MINSQELIALRNHIKQIQNELYELSSNVDYNGEHIDVLLDSIFGSLDFAKDNVDTLIKDAYWEQNLIARNHTLRGLFEEYKTIRDLIGSETRCT